MTVTFSHVSASYERGGKKVLSDLSFTAASGRRLAILGNNGSGKTTLLKTLSGILPYEGSVTVDGKELSSLSRKEAALFVSHLQQIPPAFFSYTVKETVAHGRYLREKPGLFPDHTKKDGLFLSRLLDDTGLSSLAERRIDTLSGGQLQRVFLARALAQETPVLLLDEPNSHLDLKVLAELTAYLLDWSTKKTTLPDGRVLDNTLIGVFHDLSLTRRIAQDVLLLKDGHLVAFGEADTLLSDASLLSDVFDFDVLAWRNGDGPFCTAL